MHSCTAAQGVTPRPPVLACTGVTPITLRLRELRLRRHWSQAELGRRAGVSASTINRAERGETRTLSLDNLDKLARALGVNPRSLLASS